MITANTAITTMINSPVRTIRGRVEQYNGSTLLGSYAYNGDLVSITVERVGDESKFFGFGIIHKLNVKIRDVNRAKSFSTSNTLKVYLGTESSYINPYPVFKVSEVHRDENTNQLSITAYDTLYQASKYTVADLGLSNYNIYQFAAAIASKLGLSLLAVNCSFSESNFVLSYPEGANYEGTEGLRDALDDVAEATQTIYYIDNNNRLVFKRINENSPSVYTIDKSRYIELDSKTNRRLAAVCHATQLGDNVSSSLAESGTTQYIFDNPFYELRTDIATIVDTALANVGGLTINQFDCNWRGNFLLESGDKIALITKNNEIMYSYILNDTITYDGTLAEQTSWNYSASDSETPSNPSSIGDAINQTYARVDKVNKEIEMVVKDNEELKETVSQIKLDSDGIIASVEEMLLENNSKFDDIDKDITTLTKNIAAIELNSSSISASVEKVVEDTTNAMGNLSDEIATLATRVDATMTAEDVKLTVQSEMENGASKVITSTGFTFNDEGLTIDKSGTEMKTQITEDGMTVFRNDSPMLVADNVGVKAVNLHATTYLIIGLNSRFEDYDGNRTGCFFIGSTN